MFWSRLDLFDPLLDMYLMPSDFDSEKAQVDGTTAHAIERIIGKTLHDVTEKTMYLVDTDGKIAEVGDVDLTQKYTYAE